MCPVLWISLCATRLGESMACATFQSRKLSQQRVQIVLRWTVELIDVEEVGVRNHRHLPAPDRAVSREARRADAA